MHIPQNKTCYYLGSYATYWDAENRAIRAPNQLWSLKDYPIHNRPFLFGEYIAETEQAQIDALRRKYGPWNMFAWSNPSRLTPMQKRAFTEDVMQPDGTWKPSIYSDMEHDFSGITLLHKRVNLENIFSQQAWIDEINAKYENCIKNEYPGQKPSTWTKPTARDFQRPVTDLQLPEPTAFARPMGIPGETVLTLNLLFYTIEERAFGIQTNIGIKL